MATEEKKHFADKHTGEKPDGKIKDKIIEHSKNREIPCAVVFNIARQLEKPAGMVGKNVDLMNFRLTKCQLGLFGYKPEKKIVKPHDHEWGELKDAVKSQSLDGKLPCKEAWDIAAQFKVRKMEISGLCEFMGIKIKPCQLGAF